MTTDKKLENKALNRVVKLIALISWLKSDGLGNESSHAEIYVISKLVIFL